MSDPLYPLFSVLAFLGFALSLIPLPWHFLAWNSGTCYYMIWTALACLNQFVNSVVWEGNARNTVPIWCDISTRIMLAASVGIPASALCIVRRLYHIASIRSVSITPAEKRRVVLIDSLICVLFPLMYTALQYVVQGHRFDIFEDIGCWPAIYNTLLTYFISSMWPIIIGLVSAIYCVLALKAFARRRSQFKEIQSINQYLTASRYIRLMALAATEMLCMTPLAIFTMYLDATAPLEPWISWSDTHYKFSRVDQWLAVVWHQSRPVVIGLQLSRWAPVACAFIFFIFFGFAQEARSHYKKAFWAVARCVGISRANKTSPSGTFEFRRFQRESVVFPRPTPALDTPSTPSSRFGRTDSVISSTTESSIPTSYDSKKASLEATSQTTETPQEAHHEPERPQAQSFLRPALPPVPPERRFTC